MTFSESIDELMEDGMIEFRDNCTHCVFTFKGDQSFSILKDKDVMKKALAISFIIRTRKE